MKNKDITSALIGGMFFAIPYLGMSVALVPSLVIGGIAFAGGELIFSDIKPKETLKTTNISLYKKVENARKENKEILKLIPKVEDTGTKNNLKSISESVDKILNYIVDNPKKAKNLNNFFDYYLPVLINIVSKYDRIENQKLTSNEVKSFLTKAGKVIASTDDAFKILLDSLYQNEIIDTEADLKVYEMMMKADGISGENLFNKGSDKDE